MNGRITVWTASMMVAGTLVACQAEQTAPVMAPAARATGASAPAPDTTASSEQQPAARNIPVAEGTGEEENLHQALLPQAGVLVGSWSGYWTSRRARDAEGVVAQLVLEESGGLRVDTGMQQFTGRWQLEDVTAHRVGHDRMLDARVAFWWDGGPAGRCAIDEAGVYLLRVNLERTSFVVAEQLAEPCVVRHDWWFGATMQRAR